VFYFSNFWTDIGSTINEHPHKGFEILTYVIRGRVEHQLAGAKTPIKVTSGDVELLKSGYGVRHKEILAPNTQVIQIWLDPNLRNSLANKPSIELFKSNEFKNYELNGHTRKIIFGDDNSPLNIESENISIVDHKFPPGLRSEKIPEDRFVCGYVLKGELEIGNQTVHEDGFFIAKDIPKFSYDVVGYTRVLMINSPATPSYKTYLQLKADKAEDDH
jgi:hypothetical protein